MLEDTNSLDGAQLFLLVSSFKTMHEVYTNVWHGEFTNTQKKKKHNKN